MFLFDKLAISVIAGVFLAGVAIGIMITKELETPKCKKERKNEK